MLKYVLLILGFVLLIKGADFFVEGSSSIARLLHIPSIIIGLTVVAFGTSMPEASVSITAALSGENELSLSNVLGSNIFNLLFIIGICGIIHPFKVDKSLLKREIPYTILLTVFLLAFSMDKILRKESINELSRIEGILLLLLFILFLVFVVKAALSGRKSETEKASKNKKQVMNKKEEKSKKVISPAMSAFFIVIGLAGIVIGGDLVVKSASKIAVEFGLSSTLIGLTIVALGTSLPELVTSIVASKKGENGIALGNVVGSNIFNVALILGLSALLNPVLVQTVSIYDTITLLAASALTLLFAKTKDTIGRVEGGLMLVIYTIFFCIVIIR